jgi:hypothetical protein
LIADLSTKLQALLNENASAILTATGVVGTVGTAVLTGRATFRAAEILSDQEFNAPLDDGKETTKMQKVAAVWPLYLPPIGVGGGTIAAIIMANRISAKRAAALAAAYSITEGQFKEYKDKALETLGVNKEKKLRDEVAAQKVKDNPPNKEVIIVANGDVLFYDTITGRYFESTVEKVNKAINHVLSEIYNYNASSLSVFFEDLGLPATDYTDNVGWNNETMPEVDFSTTTTPDDRPCMTVSLHPMPKPDYEFRPY